MKILATAFQRRPRLMRVLAVISALLLTGCAETPIKLTATSASAIKTFKVVAVEPPPLEVIPDLIESRIPAYRHLNNMALPSYSISALYRSPGGILIAGQTDASDSLETPSLYSKDNWMPTMDLASSAADLLSRYGFNATTSPDLLQLPDKPHKRNANVDEWREAVHQWYESNDASSGYNAPNAMKPDAVMELCISDYRIFEGQTSLRVLIKIIDTKTQRVIAKTSPKTYSFEDHGQFLLQPDGTAFKALIKRMGIQLLAQGFREMGLFTTATGTTPYPL